MGFNYYTEKAMVDEGLGKTIRGDLPPRKEMPKFDVLVIDEAQDMTPLLYRFVNKFLCDQVRLYSCAPQYLVIGDTLQTIYDFKMADARFLSLCAKTMPPNGRPWVARELHTSYRMTGNMATFVNECMVSKPLIVPHKGSGPPVRYYTGCPWRSADNIGREIVQLIESGRRPDDIFILAPSLKSNSPKNPLKCLDNYLADKKIPLYLPLHDNAVVRDEVTKGKVAFSTFHQAKGRERPHVVVFSFSNQYYDYYATGKDPSKCHNALYVAATRSLETLTLVAEESVGEHLPFLNRRKMEELKTSGVIETRNFVANRRFKKDHVQKERGKLGATELSKLIEILRGDECVVKDSELEASASESYFHRFVTDFTKYLPEHVEDKAMKILKRTRVAPPGEIITISGTVDSPFTSTGLPEEVSHLNGLAIPAMLEAELTGKCSMYSSLEAEVDHIEGECTTRNVIRSVLKNESNMHHHVVSQFKKLPPPGGKTNPAYFLELAALYRAGVAPDSKGFISSLKQLKDFNWMPKEKAVACVNRLREAVREGKADISPLTQFQCILPPPPRGPLHMNIPTTTGKSIKLCIQGMVDIVTPSSIWEIKCTSALQNCHFLQLAIYGWLWQKCEEKAKGSRKLMLFNVLTTELWEIDTKNLHEVFAILLQYHLVGQPELTDEEFLEECKMYTKPGSNNDRDAIEAEPEEGIEGEHRGSVHRPAAALQHRQEKGPGAEPASGRDPHDGRS